ncbi:MAG: alpha-N-arabinofuranosidase [Paraglaciecola sp.]|nr:alpha-N-arabinofuranosidase [Paraglaciecola sp.]NCT48280.1 alpha-N-arabinofuranosidase [Paraglaciecola sp.]
MPNKPHIFISLLLLLGSFSLFAANSQQVTLSLQPDKQGDIINKNIYGQFMEHLGRGIYEGIWVGEQSNIPNQDGFRLDVLKALKELQVPLLRWPGGCFADEYHWRDGIGPRAERPKTVNSNWGGVIEDNAFGTHEFFALAELLDAETYVNGNLGTGTPQEMAEWLHYMTSDAPTTLVAERRKNGRDKPWKVDYFAIGNESWGCGGTMRPEYYADLYKHYATFLKSPADNQPIMIASGGTDSQTQWTQTLLEQIPEYWTMRMQAISHHYYTLPTGDWQVKGSATGFGEEQWFSTLKNTLKIEDYIQANLAIMDKLDPQKKVGFYVDEWGTWYDVDEGTNPGFLYQQNTLRDAIVVGLNLHIFHRYAQRIQMTNIAQMINVLQAMILTDGEKMLLTPSYYAFQMHIPFQNAHAIPFNVDHTPLYKLNDQSIPALSASAAIGEDGHTYLSLVNSQAKGEINVVVNNVKQVVGKVLASNKLDAHNTFAQPDAITPQPFSAKVKNGRASIVLPASALVVVDLGKL